MEYGEYSAFNMIRTQDFYLVPLCLIVLMFFIRSMYMRYRDTPVQRYILPAFALRIVGAIIYTMVIHYYYGFGDSHNYYQGVLDLHHAVSDDASFINDIYGKMKLQPTDRIFPYFYYDGYGVSHYYMQEVRTYNVSRFALPFSLLFNKSFLCISFCISFLSFHGSWRIFKMFYEMYPTIHKKIALATLFLPSLLFWGTSLLKDPICVAAMGYFTYACYSALIKKKNITSSIIIIILSGLVLNNLKPYILLCMSAVFMLWVFLRIRDKIEDKTMRIVSTSFFVAAAMAVGFFLSNSLADSEASQFSSDKLLGTVQKQQAIFGNSGEDEGGGGGSKFSVAKAESPLQLAAGFPLGIVNTFFRPFPWDVRSPVAILSALEAFAFLALTWMCFRRLGIKQTFNIMFSEPVIAFCFIFAILFGGIIGLTTTNFGALSRYKIPCIPFYAMAFILIMHKSGKFNQPFIFSKRLF